MIRISSACVPAAHGSPEPVFEFGEEELGKIRSVQKTLQLTPDGACGCAGKVTVSLNATLGSEEEMILEPGDDYDSWRPTASVKDMPGIDFTPAGPLRVTARIMPKKSGEEARKARIDFALEDVTRHTGRCGNFPRGGAEKEDLRFADRQPEGIVVEGKTAHTAEKVSEAAVYVEAADFAAWGRLTASASPTTGKVPRISIRQRTTSM